MPSSCLKTAIEDDRESPLTVLPYYFDIGQAYQNQEVLSDEKLADNPQNRP
jgi:hypothetical protein